MNAIRSLLLILAICVMFQCKNTTSNIENNNNLYECSNSKLITSIIDDSIEEGFGEIYGYVFIDGDTNVNILSNVFETKLYLLDTNFCININGEYRLKLPIGKYKVLVESKHRTPSLRRIDLINKESIHINFYLNGIWK